jgi:hypothetical protein
MIDLQARGPLVCARHLAAKTAAESQDGFSIHLHMGSSKNFLKLATNLL